MEDRRKGVLREGRVDLLLELENARAEAAALRGWIERHCPAAPILRVTDCGREILDRLSLAETVSHDSVVEGLFELRDSLALALSMVAVTRERRGMWRHLKHVLNRWGDVHLRLVGGGDVRDGTSGE